MNNIIAALIGGLTSMAINRTKKIEIIHKVAATILVTMYLTPAVILFFNVPSEYKMAVFALFGFMSIEIVYFIRKTVPEILERIVEAKMENITNSVKKNTVEIKKNKEGIDEISKNRNGQNDRENKGE